MRRGECSVIDVRVGENDGGVRILTSGESDDKDRTRREGVGRSLTMDSNVRRRL